MPRMSKSNAREVLMKDCDTFYKLTNEVVGIVTTWKGTLTVLGPETFQEVINNNRDEVWNSLTKISTQSSQHHEKYHNDKCMLKLLKENTSKLSLQCLRKLASWITHQSIGITTNFWGREEYKPIWWPEEIPFVCISNSRQKNTKNATKEQIVTIIESYKNHNNLKVNIDASNSQKLILTSTPQKRRSASPPDMPSPKRINSDDSLTSEDDYFFGGILDVVKKKTTKKSDQPSLSNNPVPQLSPSLRKQCIEELSVPNKMLSDVAIIAFSRILKNSYSSIDGLQDPIFSQNLSFKKVQPDKQSIQFHYDERKIHWVCSSFEKTNGVYLYDSLNSFKISTDLQAQLALLYADNSMQVNITMPRIQSQKGGTDCGLFAATAIASGQDPASLSWDQAEMRKHFIRCIENEIITPFPVTITRGKRTGKLPHPQNFLIDCICDCNLPENAYEKFALPGSVLCDKCGFWFHKKCYNMLCTSNISNFLCKNCTVQNTHKSLFTDS